MPILEFFQSLNLSALPEQAQQFIQSEILSDVDGMEATADDNETFIWLQNEIRSKYPEAIPSGKVEIPSDTEPTRADYLREIETLQMMLEFASDEEKSTYETEIETLQMMMDLLPDDEMANGGNVLSEVEMHEELFAFLTSHSKIDEAIGTFEAPVSTFTITHGGLQKKITVNYQKKTVLISRVGNYQEPNFSTTNIKKILEANMFKKPMVTQMKKGGEIESEDLFETPELVPNEVHDIFEEHMDGIQGGDYAEIKVALDKVELLGYTFDYDLNGELSNLRKIKK